MKAWTDLNLIAKPPNIAALPVDARGYPVQYTAAIGANGQPDFRVVDSVKWENALMKKLCGICGQKIKGLFYFVGGPRAIDNRAFVDVHMHKTCAEYALKVCPFLAAPRFAYSRNDEVKVEGQKATTVIESVSTKRPDYFGLGETAGYRLRQHGNDVILYTDHWLSVQWWQHGHLLEKKPS